MYKYLSILSFSLFTINAFAESDCLKQLKETNVKNIVDTCFTFEKGKRDMATLFGTNFKHEFGSKDNPSIEAIYLKGIADKGDPQAQFVWGKFVLGLAYREITDLDIRKERDKWVSKKY
jgi:hypothetical protein